MKSNIESIKPFSDAELAIIEQAAYIIKWKARDNGVIFNSAAIAKDYFGAELAKYEREQFMVVMLNTQHQLICSEILFSGTIDSAAVYPREVVKAALKHNAAAIFLAHNHPSGVSEPSQADINITERIRKALNLVDIRLLDHFIVGLGEVTSLAERGLI